MPSRVLQRPMRAQRAVGRYSARLCPQGTAIDDVDVPIYPLKHPMCMGINVPQNICRKIVKTPHKDVPLEHEFI